jgi:hypothetical protein
MEPRTAAKQSEERKREEMSQSVHSRKTGSARDVRACLPSAAGPSDSDQSDASVRPSLSCEEQTEA